MARDDENIDVEQWQSDLSEHLVKEVFGLIQKEAQEHGKDFGDTVCLNVIASLVSTMLFSTLSESPPGVEAKEQIVKMVTENFQVMKNAIENAVASGFQGAMTTYSGKPLEYHCQVRLIPEPINKMPC